MAILILIAIHIIAFFVPIMAKILIHFDYVLVLFATWVFVFGAGGFNDYALLVGHNVHTVFTILIYIAALAIWYGIQQIRIFGIYIFRIIACALSAIILTYLVSTGLLGQTIADGMDTIWMWTFGIIYFGVAVGLRAKSSTIIDRD